MVEINDSEKIDLGKKLLDGFNNGKCPKISGVFNKKKSNDSEINDSEINDLCKKLLDVRKENIVFFTLSEALKWFKNQKNIIQGKIGLSDRLIFTTHFEKELHDISFTIEQHIYNHSGYEYFARHVNADKVDEEPKKLHNDREIYVYPMS